MNETFKSERAPEPVGAFPHAKRVGELCEQFAWRDGFFSLAAPRKAAFGWFIRQSETKFGADSFFALNAYASIVRLDKGFYDSQTEAQSALFRRVAFQFIKHFFELLLRNSSAVVGYPTFNEIFALARSDGDLSTRRIFNRVCD